MTLDRSEDSSPRISRFYKVLKHLRVYEGALAPKQRTLEVVRSKPDSLVQLGVV